MATTGATIGNDEGIRSSGKTLWRGKESVATVTLTAVLTLAQTATTEAFIGIVDPLVLPLATMPGTQRFAGLRYDASASANWFTNNGDGAANTTGDTGIAASTSEITLKMAWGASNIIYSVNGSTTNTITLNRPTEDRGYEIWMFLQTEANAAKTIYIDKVLVELT